MKKIVILTESDLTRIVKRVIKENNNYLSFLKRRIGNENDFKIKILSDIISLIEESIDMCEDFRNYDDFLMFTLTDVSKAYISSYEYLDKLEGQDYDELVKFVYDYIVMEFGEVIKAAYDMACN
jgi:hypothetical protein